MKKILIFLSWVDVYYPDRPEAIENLCLYDSLRLYDLVKNEPKKGGNHFQYGKKFLRFRQNPYLINHSKFNQSFQKKKEPGSYYHSLLLLFKPWREIEDLKCGKKLI